jgi:hypothetical protein
MQSEAMAADWRSAPRGRVAVVPIVSVGALDAIQSSAREYCNDS